MLSAERADFGKMARVGSINFHRVRNCLTVSTACFGGVVVVEFIHIHVIQKRATEMEVEMTIVKQRREVKGVRRWRRYRWKWMRRGI